ncbi:hypothetical protein GQ457_06G044130 [Hibiscus cannabinus]
MLEFRVVPSNHANGFASLIEQLRLQHLVYAENGTEALVMNCHTMLHYIPEESLSPLPNANSTPYTFEPSPNRSLRTMFLKALRGLNPTIVILVKVCVQLSMDTVRYGDTFLPKGSKQRQWYEADICWKIHNVIAQEGLQRVERVESKSRWMQRMRNAEFRGG